MVEPNIGERIASLEAEFRSYRKEATKDSSYIKSKLDKIVEEMPAKVDRAFCLRRHEKLADKIAEIETNGGKEKIFERLRKLEQKTPAIIQQVMVAIMTAVLTAIAIKAVP